MWVRLPWALSHPFDSLRRRLAVLFAVVLLPPTVLSLYLAWTAFQEQTERARLSVRQFAVLVSSYERDFFRDTQRLLSSLAAEPAIKSIDPQECQKVLARTQESFPEYVSISASDRSGTVICTTSEKLVKANVANRNWFADALINRNFTLSDYTLSQDSAVPVIVAASPIRDEENKVTGVLHIDIDLDWLSLFVRGAGLPADGTVFLLDQNGVILASPRYIFEPTEAGLPDAETLQKVVQRKLIDFDAIGADGHKRVYSSVALPHGNVLVLFGLPAATTLGWIERDLLIRMLSVAAIWLAGIFAAGIGTRLWVTRWIAQLVRTARAYSRGDFSAPVKLERAPVELRDLGATLVNMAERIEAREEDLRQSLEQKDTLLKEIHHRVKNNLQTITSLLNIHMRSVPTEGAHQALEELQTRVRALSLAHRYLYESEDVRVVDLQLFVGELCQVLHDTLGGAQRQIAIEADVHNITISSERAVAIALLITEAITNSFKHAFPNSRPGRISVGLHRIDETTGLLRISDDGVGRQDALEESELGVSGQGVGISLISAFARQLGDDLKIEGPPGTTISLRLRLPTRAKSAPAHRQETAALSVKAGSNGEAPADGPAAPPEEEPRHSSVGAV